MGVLSGTLSYMRYFVEGPSPLQDRDAFLERIQQYSIPELTPDSEEEQAVGWTNTESVLDTTFRHETVFFNEYVLFSFRVDSWKLPSALLKAYQAEAEKRFMAEQNREKLGKRERSNIKDTVRKQLKQQLLPYLATYDICWQVDKGLLRFWSLSNRINELFIELFEKTFAVHLVPQTPYTLAERIGLEEPQLALLATFEPEAFAATHEEDE